MAAAASRTAGSHRLVSNIPDLIIMHESLLKTAPDSIVNAMTVDVEDYFQVSAFEGVVNRKTWEHLPCRVEQNTDNILEMFNAHGVKATFFMLGWVAERYPQVVRRIVDAGHELASHGYYHVRVTRQQPQEFIEDISRTRKLLEDTAGCEVSGYRAASYSIVKETLWAHDLLQEAGYRYSSSVYPIRHDMYGIPDAPRFAYRHKHEGLLEIPVTTVSLFNHNLPCGGGGYFRLLPYRASRWAMKRVNSKDRMPCVFYFHPWEIDPEQPKQAGISSKTRFRHYLNLQRMETRIERLLEDFNWDRMDNVFLARGDTQ
jgi:polysaccharide deacetylase family protein (PEP-CTERM system associated)